MSAILEVDLGPTDIGREGAYRRGYHQAVAEVAYVIKLKQLSADDLESWVGGSGMHWRNGATLDRKIEPLEIG
jgi:hypothetical protein